LDPVPEAKNVPEAASAVGQTVKAVPAMAQQADCDPLVGVALRVEGVPRVGGVRLVAGDPQVGTLFDDAPQAEGDP